MELLQPTQDLSVSVLVSACTYTPTQEPAHTGIPKFKKTKSKHDVQVFCGMLASFQTRKPAIPMNCTFLKAATGARGKKFVWTEEMEYEYKNLRKQLKLSSYDPNQELRLVIDGARTAGIGFLLIQYIDDKDVEKGVKIIHSGSNSPIRTRF